MTGCHCHEQTWYYNLYLSWLYPNGVLSVSGIDECYFFFWPTSRLPIALYQQLLRAHSTRITLAWSSIHIEANMLPNPSQHAPLLNGKPILLLLLASNISLSRNATTTSIPACNSLGCKKGTAEDTEEAYLAQHESIPACNSLDWYEFICSLFRFQWPSLLVETLSSQTCVPVTSQTVR